MATRSRFFCLLVLAFLMGVSCRVREQVVSRCNLPTYTRDLERSCGLDGIERMRMRAAERNENATSEETKKVNDQIYRKYKEVLECSAKRSGLMDSTLTDFNQTALYKYIADHEAPEEYKDMMRKAMPKCIERVENFTKNILPERLKSGDFSEAQKEFLGAKCLKLYRLVGCMRFTNDRRMRQICYVRVQPQHREQIDDMKEVKQQDNNNA